MGRRGEEEERGGLRDRPWAERLSFPPAPRSTPRPLSPPIPTVPAQRDGGARHVASAHAGKDVGVVDVANGGTGP